MSEHPEYVDDLDELVDDFDHANPRKSLEAALLKGRELERAEWQGATDCEGPSQTEKAIAVCYEWLHSWQFWAVQMLQNIGHQLEDGFHGDSQARDILGARLEKETRAPTTDDELCPNCVTPWKCNGPHEFPDEGFMVTIYINGTEFQVPFAEYLTYDSVVSLERGKVVPYLTVVYKSERGSGSMYQGSDPVKPVEGMYFSIAHTGNS